MLSTQLRHSPASLAHPFSFRNTKRVVFLTFGVLQKDMPFDFDPAKDAQNRKQHGMSLAEAEDFNFDTAFTVEDDREAYGEQRFFAIGQMRSTGRIVALAYTLRNDEPRPISLRKATPRESRRWPVR